MPRLGLLTLAALVLPAAVAAQGRSDRGAFIVRLGSDTLAVERFSRSGTRFESDIAARTPRTRRVHYTATLNPNGTVARLRVVGTSISQGPDQLPPFDATIVFGKDSATTTLKLGDSTQVVPAATPPGTMPVTQFSFALYELITMRARQSKADSMRLDVIGIGANQTFESYVVRRGADSMDIGYFGSPMHGKVDRNGRLLGIDGSATTNKVIVERVSTVDVDRTVRDFAARDAAGQVVGQLSPRDTVTATVGNAHLTIDYGRPHRRGREIFGGIVPWGEVWRTGANAATGFNTDADLMIKGTAIPKGSYTLWTLPSPNGTKLIVNSQTGQWGTQYDATKDFARIDLASEQVAEPVEIFTIAVEPKDQGGVLTFAWDRTRMSVPFTVQ